MEQHAKLKLFASGLIVGLTIASGTWLFLKQEKRNTANVAPINKTELTNEEGFPLPILSDTQYKDINPATRMTIDISYPTVKINKRSDVEVKVNTSIKKFIDNIAEDFKQEEAATDLNGMQESFESSLTMNWDSMIVSPEIISIRFNYSAYAAGAAHPNNMSRIFTYDMTQKKVLQTQELFVSQSAALPFLSEYSRVALKKSMKDLSSEEFNTQVLPGTEPTIENFREVALTKEGLVIVFNPYQVASYARGTQDILVAKSDLAGLLTETVQNALRDAR